jgi:hypothetical protein
MPRLPREKGYIVLLVKGATLTTCISSHNKDKPILVMVQPPYVLVSTNSSGDWYADIGLQIVKEIKGFLLREKRMVRLIIAGIAAFVTMIATAATVVVALTQAVQNAHYVTRWMFASTYLRLCLSH